jgi:hypothetical protein
MVRRVRETWGRARVGRRERGGARFYRGGRGEERVGLEREINGRQVFMEAIDASVSNESNGGREKRKQ